MRLRLLKLAVSLGILLASALLTFVIKVGELIRLVFALWTLGLAAGIAYTLLQAFLFHGLPSLF